MHIEKAATLQPREFARLDIRITSTPTPTTMAISLYVNLEAGNPFAESDGNEQR